MFLQGCQGQGYSGSAWAGERVSMGVPGERESLCALRVQRGVFFHQTAPERPRPPRGMGEPAQRVGQRLSRSLCPPGRAQGWRWAQRHLVGPQRGIRGVSRKLMASMEERGMTMGTSGLGDPGRPNHSLILSHQIWGAPISWDAKDPRCFPEAFPLPSKPVPSPSWHPSPSSDS